MRSKKLAADEYGAANGATQNKEFYGMQHAKAIVFPCLFDNIRMVTRPEPLSHKGCSPPCRQDPCATTLSAMLCFGARTQPG
jgi:hypothetical protein